MMIKNSITPTTAHSAAASFSIITSFVTTNSASSYTHIAQQHMARRDVAMSLNFTDEVNIQAVVPQELALPIYGYLLPIVVMITVVTNSFIVLVLSQPQLRTATNFILLSMAVAEVLTGLGSFPWMLYYYTFGGYRRDSEVGMPSFWCRSFQYFAELLPTVFHTSAIWLTVYLAIQRYWYVCSSHVNMVSYSNPSIGRSKVAVTLICAAAIVVELPVAFGKYTYPHFHNDYVICRTAVNDWVIELGPNYVYACYYWFMVIFVHAGPCTLLVIFGGLLIRTVRNAMKRRRESLGLLLRERAGSSAGVSSSTAANLHATTKMLIVVIVIFLITEIPAAVIFTLHVLMVTFRIFPELSYHSMNAALILRNVFILVSYPFNFAVYLSMSYQFRVTVKRLFCKRADMYSTNNGYPRRAGAHGYPQVTDATMRAQKISSPQLRSHVLAPGALDAGLYDHRRATYHCLYPSGKPSADATELTVAASPYPTLHWPPDARRYTPTPGGERTSDLDQPLSGPARRSVSELAQTSEDKDEDCRKPLLNGDTLHRDSANGYTTRGDSANGAHVSGETEWKTPIIVYSDAQDGPCKKYSLNYTVHYAHHNRYYDGEKRRSLSDSRGKAPLYRFIVDVGDIERML